MNLSLDKTLMAPMRDGVALATDVYRPDQGGPWATLVLRTPYNKSLIPLTDILRLAHAGYAVVVQDTRGRFASDGAFAPFVHEAHDGADTISWAAAQPWSTGRVGAVGVSYAGATQWLAATQAPPALRALAPYLAPALPARGLAYQDGAFTLGSSLYWALDSLALGEIERRQARGGDAARDRDAVIAALDAIDALYERLPLIETLPSAAWAPYYVDRLDHPDEAADWVPQQGSYARIGAPALNIGGWYDSLLGGTLANYAAMRRQGATAAARRHQRLVIGPWAHMVRDGAFAERHYGYRASAAALDLVGLQLRWFDYWLKGIDNGVTRERPVRLFIMGANVWRDEDEWPLPDTVYQPHYLHSRGGANSAAGDGTLSVVPPAEEPEDVYLYDPRHPVPTVGGQTLLTGRAASATAGPRDQRGVEGRADVLCYTSAPLERPVEVTGPVRLVLYAASSARDTDFTGKLVDVAPDGRAEILTEGILRARYRDSRARPSLLEPGRIYELHLDLWATANVFAAGHRIRLDVASSNFPRFDRNTNTGGVIARDGAADLVQAANRVYHDRTHPSHLLLPCIRRE